MLDFRQSSLPDIAGVFPALAGLFAGALGGVVEAYLDCGEFHGFNSKHCIDGSRLNPNGFASSRVGFMPSLTDASVEFRSGNWLAEAGLIIVPPVVNFPLPGLLDFRLVLPRQGSVVQIREFHSFRWFQLGQQHVSPLL